MDEPPTASSSDPAPPAPPLRAPPGLLPSFPGLRLAEEREGLVSYAPPRWKPWLGLALLGLSPLLLLGGEAGRLGERPALLALVSGVLALSGLWLLLVRGRLVVDRARGALEVHLGYHGVAPLRQAWPLDEVAEVAVRARAVKPLLAPEQAVAVLCLRLVSGEEVELLTLPDAARAEEMAAGLRRALQR